MSAPGIGGREPTAQMMAQAVGGRAVVSFAISLFRCIHSGSNVTASELDADADGLLRDAWLIWNLLQDGHRQGTLFELCNDVWFDAVVPVPASGGIAGWRIAVRLAFDAYQP